MDRKGRKNADAPAKVRKVITSADGSPLIVFQYQVSQRQHRFPDGSVETIPARNIFETLTTLRAAKAWLSDTQEPWRKQCPQTVIDIDVVAAAIAAERGTSPEEEIAAALKRASGRR